MKKLLALIALTIIAATSAHAIAIFTPLGPVNVKLTSVVRDLPFQQISGKTNSTSTATNITQVYKGTVARTPFGNTNLLALIANSFKTNFPAGSQLAMRYVSLVVVDATGTNVIFTPSGVVSFHIETQFVPELKTLMTTVNAAGTQYSGNLTETIIGSVTMNYDDTDNDTTDGTHTNIELKGLWTIQLTQNLKTGVVKTVGQWNVTGGGLVRGFPTILTGSFNGKATGINGPF